MSGIANRQKLMGWKHPNQRERCQNCAHRDRSAAPAQLLRMPIRCRKGGFDTTSFSVCDEWQEAQS